MNGWEFGAIVVVCITVMILGAQVASVQRAAYRKVRPSGPTLGRHPQGTRGVLNKPPDEMDGMGLG